MRKTVARIDQELRRGGGVHRYAADTYYGGGEWVLLTAWLGWYYTRVGEREQARSALHWVEAQADADLQLAEQVPATLNDPAFLTPWNERWRPIANPLLWSHAKYLILRMDLGSARP
jgi:GH15 family glucan-1,4-alpha-glucosidase